MTSHGSASNCVTCCPTLVSVTIKIEVGEYLLPSSN